MDDKTYLDERKFLAEVERETAKTFDTSLITVTSGALGLSLFFVKDMVEETSVGYLLLVSWVAFSFGLISTMSSFLTSQTATRRQREILDHNYAGKIESVGNWAASVTHCLNWFSILSFTAGIIFLCTFIWSNLGHTQGAMKMSNEFPGKFGYVPQKQPVSRDTERGFVPPKAPASPGPAQQTVAGKPTNHSQ